ncbi:hypothetical protein APED_32435 [Acanthopleuribacter pedis]
MPDFSPWLGTGAKRPVANHGSGSTERKCAVGEPEQAKRNQRVTHVCPCNLKVRQFGVSVPRFGPQVCVPVTLLHCETSGFQEAEPRQSSASGGEKLEGPDRACSVGRCRFFHGAVLDAGGGALKSMPAGGEITLETSVFPSAVWLLSASAPPGSRMRGGFSTWQRWNQP